MEYISLLMAFINLIMLVMAILITIDYFKRSHEIKTLEKNVDELIKEAEFKLKLRN